MGKAFEKMTVVPDTGSSWLAIEGKDCTTCLGTKYNWVTDAADPTNTFLIKSATVEERNYGSVRTKGFQATDRVCLKSADATSCVDTFNLFVINEQTGIASNLDGIWGMSSGRKTISTGNQTGPLLIDALSTANKISAKIFAFGLKIASTGTSFLDFGVINNSAMRNSATELFYIPATVDYWWSNNMNGIKFGAGQNLTKAFNLNVVTPAFSDSGSTCTYIPKVYYNTIITELLTKATSYTWHSTWGYIVPCSDKTKLDPIQFLYNDVWLEI